MAMRRVRIVNLSREVILAETAEVAETPSARRRGLLGREELPEGDGLLIVPCRQVHTLGMRFPIDVIFLDRNLVVLRAVKDLRPGRISPFVLGAQAALELPSGVVRRTGTREGDQLGVDNI